jgi:hypothetical protein
MLQRHRRPELPARLPSTRARSQPLVDGRSGSYGAILAMQRAAGNVATRRFLQRSITYNATGKNAYQRSHGDLLKELVSEFPHVDQKVIDDLITDIEDAPPRWSPFQAYRGIRNKLRSDYPPKVEAVSLDGTNISQEEAQWYFISNFKTYAEVVVDDGKVMSFVNTPDDNHAEDNMMAALDKYVEEQRWHEDFTGAHTILMRINNSPCKRCAKRLYDWHYRDIFVDFAVVFANMYEKDTGFTQATTKLRSGGVVMTLMSVTNDLLALIDKEGRLSSAKRAEKDLTEQADWTKWQMQHVDSKDTEEMTG